jgi:hypothetical protein
MKEGLVSSLAMNGETYELATPLDEATLEADVVGHGKAIFGPNSLIFGKKQLSSKAGVVSIPDGYVLTVSDKPSWSVLEVELASHSLYEHFVPQMTKFCNGVRNPATINQLADFMDSQIQNQEGLEAFVTERLGKQERYRFLHGLLSRLPTILVVIDAKTDELAEVCDILPAPTKALEFRTYKRIAGTGPPKAFVFETLAGPILRTQDETGLTPKIGNMITLSVSSNSWRKFNLMQIPPKLRSFFPGYRVPFVLETDVGEIQTYMSSAPEGTVTGDPSQGKYFQVGLRKWYSAHPEAKLGSTVIIEAIEPAKRYRLSIR